MSIFGRALYPFTALRVPTGFVVMSLPSDLSEPERYIPPLQFAARDSLSCSALGKAALTLTQAFLRLHCHVKGQLKLRHLLTPDLIEEAVVKMYSGISSVAMSSSVNDPAALNRNVA